LICDAARSAAKRPIIANLDTTPSASPSHPIMTRAQTIDTKLRAALAPQRLTIIDESAQHHGHAGAHPAGETHFRVEIVSAAFAGKSRVERQRLVYAILQDELSTGLHALSLVTEAAE